MKWNKLIPDYEIDWEYVVDSETELPTPRRYYFPIDEELHQELAKRHYAGRHTIYRQLPNLQTFFTIEQLANLTWEYAELAPILNQGERLLVIRIIQGYSLEEIARMFAVHSRTLYAAINRIEAKRVTHEKLRKQNPEPLQFGDYMYRDETYYAPERHNRPQTLLKNVSFLEQENLVKQENI